MYRANDENEDVFSVAGSEILPEPVHKNTGKKRRAATTKQRNDTPRKRNHDDEEEDGETLSSSDEEERRSQASLFSYKSALTDTSNSQAGGGKKKGGGKRKKISEEEAIDNLENAYADVAGVGGDGGTGGMQSVLSELSDLNKRECFACRVGFFTEICRDLNTEEQQSLTDLLQTSNVSMSIEARCDALHYFFQRKVLVPAVARNMALEQKGEPPLPIPSWDKSMIMHHLRFHMQDAFMGTTHLLNRLKILEEVSYRRCFVRGQDGQVMINPKELKNHSLICAREVKLYTTKMHISPLFNKKLAPQKGDENKHSSSTKPDTIKNSI